MKKHLNLLKENPLFSGIDEKDLSNMLDCLSAKEKFFSKNQIIHMAGQPADRVGIVVQGSVQIIKEDILGNRNIIAQIGEGELFGEAFACAGVERLPVSIINPVDCTILFIDYKKVIVTCNNSCVFHHRLLENMLWILARKNILLNNKIEHVSKRSTKDKVLSYLMAEGQAKANRSFTIPFNRQELADYLCVDRSALSTELGKLREEGIIEYKKNDFTILEGVLE